MNIPIAQKQRKRNSALILKTLHTNDDPFRIFCKLYRSHRRLFILESLVGPRQLAEISILGFDPELVVSCDSSKFYIRNSKNKIIHIEDLTNPLEQLRRYVPIVNNNKFRYTGGAVGFVSYDAIRYWEHIPSKYKGKKIFPLLEFGIHTDGIVYDHIAKNAYYFTIGKSRYKEISSEIETEDPFQMKSFSYSAPRP
ncbi:MAG: anthranilate synthase component I, partial [Thermoproteota archaeon]|nr:anthranilate synthase component I [Thermoproteota archaeon]